MRVICSKENLMEGINIVQKAVSAKTTLPVLEGILVEAGEGFKLTANDMEIGIECYIEADVREKGAVVINSRMFGDIVRRMPESEVLIEVKEKNNVIIECENSHFEIKGFNADDFPPLPEIKKEDAFVIKQKVIREMIRQTLFAVSIDENRPILTGSLFECAEGSLTVVSIDGFRLALRKHEIGEGVKGYKVVIPGKTLNEIIKIMQPVEEAVTIFSSGSQILFDMGKCKVVSRLLDGEYLNYRTVIPKEFEIKVKIGTKELLAGMERAHLVTMGEKRYPVILNLADDKMVISANTNIGAVREEINVEMTGGKLDIAFNPAYFIEALRVIEDEKIDIYFTTSVGQCIIRPEEGDRYIYLIVPVRFKSN